MMLLGSGYSRKIEAAGDESHLSRLCARLAGCGRLDEGGTALKECTKDHIATHLLPNRLDFQRVDSDRISYQFGTTMTFDRQSRPMTMML